MKINKLIVCNFCQNSYGEYDFSTGLNGVLGRNGSGKSNLLRAISYALTGVLPDKIEDYIRVGTKAPEESYVSLVFSDTQGREYTIDRCLLPRKAMLTLPNGEVIRRIAGINEYLNETLGLDNDVINNILIPSQEDLVSILTCTTTERLTTLQRIVNLDRLAENRKQLQMLLSRVEQESPDNDSCTVLQDLITEDETALKNLGDLPEKSFIETKVREIEKELSAIQERRANLAKHTSRVELLNINRKEIAKLNKELSVLMASYFTYEEVSKLEVDDARHELTVYTSVNNQLQRWSVAHDKLVESQNTLEEQQTIAGYTLSELEERISEIRYLRDNLEKEGKEYAQLRKASDARCPLCHSPIDIAQIEAKYTELREAWDKADKELKLLAGIQQSLRTLTASVTKLSDELKLYEAVLNNTIQAEATLFGDAKCSFDSLLPIVPDLLKKAEARSAELDRKYTIKVDSEAKNADLSDASLAIRSKLELLTSHCAGLTQAIAELYTEDSTQILNEEQEYFEKELSEKRAVLTRIAHADSLKTRLDSLRSRQDTLLTRSQHYIDTADRRRTLSEVINVLHIQNLPRVAMCRIAGILVERTNEFLQLFNSPFQLSVDSQLNMFCRFSEDFSPKASRLSGGQKVILAVAWRLALHDVFSTEETCGFTTLDEPTTFLDADNIENLNSVMSVLKSSIESRGIQIIMITHETSLSPLFDNIIQL